MTRIFYTITREDVGKPWLHMFDQTHLTSSWIGRILAQDVGKRCYRVDGVIQVENDAQRAARVDRHTAKDNAGE